MHAQNGAAFFDVDGTLIRLKSMFDFLEHAAKELVDVDSQLAHRFRAGIDLLASGEVHGLSRESVNAQYYGLFRGIPYVRLCELCRSWHDTLCEQHPRYWIEDVVTRAHAHRDAGLSIVLVSGSFIELLHPFAKHVGAAYILATVLEVDDHEHLTGRIRPPQVIGPGKAHAIEKFIADRGIDLACSFAYGDHHSDIQMLEMVAHPVVVGNEPEMVEQAKRSGWPILNT